MKRFLLPILILSCLIAFMFFAPLRAFNVLVPFDAASGRVASGLSYGPEARQTLDIYKPAPARGKLPIIVFGYGGGWSSGDRAGYAFLGRAFASRGFLTIVPDYRLVPDFVFPAFVEDTAGAIAWAARHGGDFGGDTSRIFLVGHSAGAYNVAMAALDNRYLERFGTSARIVSGVATLAGPFDFLPLDDSSAIAAFSAWPDLAETQPVNLVTAEAPPFLLLTGGSDRIVGPRNSRSLARRLTSAGVAVETKEYPGIGHVGLLLAIARPLRWRAAVLDDIEAFFKKLQTAPGQHPSPHHNEQ
ncbi:MAG: alpha/beta hydrolase [Rhizobiales bacterium]|nr:alpha/beta hydrolase [Hyphomicrobiales bacterium]